MDLIIPRCPTSSTGAEILAGDIAFQLLDLVPLILDHRLDEVADGQHSDYAAGLHDRQMAETAFCHELHTVVHCILRGDGDRRRTHDVPDRGVMRGAVL